MRLINVRTLKLEEFLDDAIPEYAILSHTWGNDSEELSYHDVFQGDIDKPSVGSIKIRGCCRQAEKDGFGYCWIDTCCIDKKNLVELSEAINSMFRWYRKASICYAYLADVPKNGTRQEQRVNLGSSRWFRRGWTLQELLAPKIVQFYNMDWHLLGTKAALCSVLYKITGVPHRFLRGIADMQTASVAQRMSWAAQRETKRKEDIAYSLLGIFDVTMPMIYGEGGEQAFFRLQEQIMKKTRDDSLLAWGIGSPDSTETVAARIDTGRILAARPSDFANSGQIVPRNPSLMHPLEMSGGSLRVHLLLSVGTGEKLIGLLNCGPKRDPTQVVGIPLAKLAQGSEEYVRPKVAKSILQPLSEPGASPKTIYIRNDVHHDAPTPDEPERHLLYDEEGFSDIGLSLAEVEPKACWNEEQALIMSSVKDSDDSQVILARFRHDDEKSQDFVVLIEFENIEYRCSVLTCTRDTSLAGLLGKLQYITKTIPRQKISLKPDERQQALNLRPEVLADPPGYTWNATAELEKVDRMLEFEESLEAEARAESEEEQVNHSVQEQAGMLEQIKCSLEIIETEQRKLEENRVTLAEKETQELQVMHHLTTRQRKAKRKREETHEKRLNLQQRDEELREAVADDSNQASGSTKAQMVFGWAAQNGLVRIMNLIMNRTTNVDCLMQGASPLSLAVRQGYKIVVQMLLDQGADVDSRDLTSGATLLSLASRLGHTTIAQFLLDKDAQLNSMDDTGRTSLSWAASEGQELSTRLLLDAGASIDWSDNYGRTPLSWAASAGCAMTVQLLLNAGADRRSQDKRGLMPLYYAVYNGHEKVALGEYEAAVQLLCSPNTDIEGRDHQGDMLLTTAVRRGHRTMVQLLLDQGANIDSKNSYGDTALTLAAQRGHETIVQLLLDQGADIESKDFDEGYETIVRLLLDQGANIESKGSDVGRETVVRLLLDRGADIESKDFGGDTALMLAVEMGHETIVQLLLDQGADIESKAFDGSTALMLAIARGYQNIVQLLHDKAAIIKERC
ncbi:ankyrin repeat-containing domain protein [Xylariaceae sp. FL1651]|nr:ankyrin repeat-containing domain protein [Xylariaceae sp. FL1651]